MSSTTKKVNERTGTQLPDFDDVLASVVFFIEQNPSCEFLTTYQERSDTHQFALGHLLKKWGLQMEPLDCQGFYPEAKVEYLQDKSILLWRITMDLSNLVNSIQFTE